MQYARIATFILVTSAIVAAAANPMRGAMPSLFLAVYISYIVAAIAFWMLSRLKRTRAVVIVAALFAVGAPFAAFPNWENVSDPLFAIACIGIVTLLFRNQVRDSRESSDMLLITRHFQPDVGGTETFIASFLEEVSRKNLVVDVVVLQPLAGSVAAHPGVRLHYIRWPWLTAVLWKYRETTNPMIGALLLFLPIVTLAMRGIRVGARSRPRLVYGVGGPIATASAAIVGHTIGVPVAYHFHRMYQWGDRSRPVRWMFRKFYELAALVLGNSRLIERDTHALGVTRTKVMGITNWVDEKRFYADSDRKALREALGLKDDDAVFLFTGHFDATKHVDRIISALQELHDDRPVFLFAGYGHLEPAIRSLEREGCRVRVVGMQDSEGLRRLANAADVHFWGSVDADYPGLVIMEAMLCGCPVVTSCRSMNGRWDPNAKVAAEAFGSPEVAWVFEPTDDGILAAVQFVVENLSMLRSKRSEATVFARERFGQGNADRLFVELEKASLQKP